MNVKIQIIDQTNGKYFNPKWKLDSCYGPKNIKDQYIFDVEDNSESVKYEGNNTYVDRCCLSPGVYTLICKNEMGPYGWGNSFVEILGQRYCDDFVGYKGLRRVVVTGK